MKAIRAGWMCCGNRHSVNSPFAGRPSLPIPFHHGRPLISENCGISMLIHGALARKRISSNRMQRRVGRQGEKAVSSRFACERRDWRPCLVHGLLGQGSISLNSCQLSLTTAFVLESCTSFILARLSSIEMMRRERTCAITHCNVQIRRARLCQTRSWSSLCISESCLSFRPPSLPSLIAEGL